MRGAIVTVVQLRDPQCGVSRKRAMTQGRLERLIQSAEQGDTASREELFSVLYDELHRLAQRELRRGAHLTMSPTTLLHETYLNLSGREKVVFPDRVRFLAYASRAMRGLIIDYVRSRCAQKRGAGFEITSLPTEAPGLAQEQAEIEGIGEALTALGEIEPRLAQVVDLKFFCGFSFAEIAGVLGTSERTAQRDWDKARILLQQHLRDHGAPPAAQRRES
jgi:RNA polymerase sigma factor (TIGR02999 family)